MTEIKYERLMQSIARNDLKTFMKLKDDPESELYYHNGWPLKLACSEGHTEIVRLLLLDDKIDPSESKNNALSRAAYNGHSDIVKMIIDHPRTDLSIKKDYINSAIEGDNFQILEMLVVAYNKFIRG